MSLHHDRTNGSRWVYRQHRLYRLCPSPADQRSSVVVIFMFMCSLRLREPAAARLEVRRELLPKRCPRPSSTTRAGLD
jgi:hypothetical protein